MSVGCDGLSRSETLTVAAIESDDLAGVIRAIEAL